MAVLRVDRCLEHDACDLGRFGYFERIQRDGVLRRSPGGIRDFHRDLGFLERVFIGPVGGVRRTVIVLLDEFPIHEETYCRNRVRVRAGQLGDDADGRGRADSSERGRDPDGEGRGPLTPRLQARRKYSKRCEDRDEQPGGLTGRRVSRPWGS